MNNADVIRKMSTHELSQFLWQWYGNDDAVWFYYPEKFGKGKKRFDFRQDLEEWLNKERRGETGK